VRGAARKGGPYRYGVVDPNTYASACMSPAVAQVS